MKAYEEKVPVMVIGGCAGSFLGEYQAGGVIVVLGIDSHAKKIVGNFPGTGMHGVAPEADLLVSYYGFNNSGNITEALH